ncbi:uncharacterized protein LOC123566588 isoform X2 [Mercenaria mercenaria]|uniref:uncharacterized protein LOC123566588 isoform X2 n=1 Tax=Mercenaria mercenaria TaxID=6596 RepID=UPI00234F0652|nr:uncharacterized protein LOC123566588 isoform X2 [Mercenaria mercenaria]
MSGTGDTGQDLQAKDLDVDVPGAIGDEEVKTKVDKDQDTKTKFEQDLDVEVHGAIGNEVGTKADKDVGDKEVETKADNDIGVEEDETKPDKEVGDEEVDTKADKDQVTKTEPVQDLEVEVPVAVGNEELETKADKDQDTESNSAQTADENLKEDNTVENSQVKSIFDEIQESNAYEPSQETDDNTPKQHVALEKTEDENPQVPGQSAPSQGQFEDEAVDTENLVKDVGGEGTSDNSQALEQSTHTPKVLEQSSSKNFEESSPNVSEQSAPTILEESSLKVAEQIVSKVLEESTLIVSSEQSAHKLSEESESIVTEQSESSVTEQSAPSVTEQSAPTVTEESAPTVTEESAPTVTEQSAPSITEESAPSVAEQSAPSVTEQSASKELEATADEKEGSADETHSGFLDILGNGTLLKKILEAGSGKRPNMGDEVIVNVLQEIPELGKVFPRQHLQYVLGDGDVVQALDLAVALMNVGEKAVVLAGFKYMYGDLGEEPNIPPRSNFKLTVKLIATNGPLDYPSMSFTTRFEYAKKKKDKGNDLIKKKDYLAALNSYTKASKIVDSGLGCVYDDETAESLQELLEFRAVVLCNASFANFKLEAYDAAIKMAKEACTLRPVYSKGYWRMAQAQEKLGSLDEAMRNYKLALKHDKSNGKFFQQELDRLRKVKREKKQSEKEMYSKMFWGSKPPEMDKPKEKPPEASLSSWFWRTGATVVGAGLVGLAGIGVYKYLNH